MLARLIPSRLAAFAGNYGLSEIAAGNKAREWSSRFGVQAYAEALAEIHRLLAAWQPPVISGPPCADCEELVVVARWFNGALRRCPRCATYYRYWTYDDDETLTRLTDAEAAATVETYNAREAAWLRSR
jgi:hypothetical protein